MHNSSERRWNMTSAKVGAFLWIVIAVLVFLGRTPLGVIDVLFLLAPLVVVPLGLELLRRHAFAQPVTLGRIACIVQPFAALLAVVSFWFPAGLFAGALASAWLLFGGLMAFAALPDLFRQSRWALDRVVFAAACIDLAIGAGWFATSRAGMSPMDFQEPIVLLTGVHFHFSGFAAALLAGATLKLCRGKGTIGVAKWIVAAAVFVPYLLAAGFVFSPGLKLACALVLAAALLGFALMQLSIAGDFASMRVRTLLRTSAGLLIPGMLLAAVYALGEYTGNYWLVIPQMARVHGILNGPGFALLGLLAWVLERPNRKRVLQPIGEALAGAAYFSDTRRAS